MMGEAVHLASCLLQRDVHTIPRDPGRKKHGKCSSTLTQWQPQRH
jgi:hypothetical protein